MRVDLVRTSQDCGALVPLLAQAYADHPDRELRALLYARTLAMAGRLSEAGEVARDFRGRLKDSTGAEPTTEFTETMSRLAQRDPAALSRAWQSSVNVPPSSGPLIGRDLEVHAAVTMLEVGASALVTISGVHGVGKSRVAAAVARAVADDLPGGVLWIDATTASGSDDVLELMGAALGLHGTAATLRQALPRALGERRRLVVVDGVEGVDVKGALAVALGAGPRVSVIATASERIGLASEQVLTLQPFATAGSASPAAAFVMAMLDLLAPGLRVAEPTLAPAVERTSGTPSELEQVALDLISGAG